MQRIGIQGEYFKDESGRVVLLRGVNLGGDCKTPYPDGGTHHPSDFADHREVSFIGRPFPLDEAEEHFARLRGWGFNCLRLLTTWEAIEHAGPGRYDESYLDYFTELCRLAGEYGLYVFVDFHQDVWSRMSGGDGAPGWLWETVGIDYRALGPTGAALIMQHSYDYADPRARQEDNYPTMTWPTNYQRPANGIMWTLFFGGRIFTPDFLVEGQNIQDYLQATYLGAVRAVAERVKDMPHVLGFDTLNEPHSGYIGIRMEDRGTRPPGGHPPALGVAFSPADGLFLADGATLTLPIGRIAILRGGVVYDNQATMNPDGRSIWLDGATDPFRAAGAWKVNANGERVVQDPEFFCKRDGRDIDFHADAFVPFARRVAETIRAVRADWLLFVEKPAGETLMNPELPRGLPENTVNASHWYDILTNFSKRFRRLTIDVRSLRPVFGLKGVERMYTRHLSDYREASRALNDGKGAPTLLGEFGIPFDLVHGRAFARFGGGDRSETIWRDHIHALNAMYNACDRLWLSTAQWNYTASNSNDLKIGDGWNQEDFSIFSEDQRTDYRDPDSGGRALRGFARPFARRVQGTPLAMRFDLKRRRFRFAFNADPAIPEPTEIFVPRVQYPDGFEVRADGLEINRDDETRIIHARASRAGEYTIEIRAKRGAG